MNGCISDALFAIYTTIHNPCVNVESIISARGFHLFPETGLYQGIQLNQARLNLNIAHEQFFSRIGMNAIRSTGQNSYMGIDGESFVWQVQLMEGNTFLRWNGHQLRISGGLNENFWVKTQNEHWALRSIHLGLAEDYGTEIRTDTGVSVLYQFQGLDIGYRLSSGEGMRRSERNIGLNSELYLGLHNAHFQWELYGQEGSIGPSRARNHRIGSRLSGSYEHTVLSTEIIKNYGVSGDAAREPLLISSYVTHLPFTKFAYYARVDYIQENSLSNDQNKGQRYHLGYGYPLSKTHNLNRLWLGWTGTRLDSQIPLIAGNQALAHNDLFFIQMTINTHFMEP